jgi:hypothetical protein
VQSKIQHIEKTFKEAYTFATSETGAGLKETDEGTFHDAVKKKCPYYFDLLDIMSDRASSKPKATSYEASTDTELDEFMEDKMSELSEEEEAAEKSVASKRTSATTSTRKAKKKKTPSLLDDDAMAALNEASATSKHRMDELVRHNQFIEKLEERKLALEEKREQRATVSWQGKTDELQYKMQLLEHYNQLKKTHKWTDEQIIAFYPDMKQIIDAKNG